jgi:hypothetical protein
VCQESFGAGSSASSTATASPNHCQAHEGRGSASGPAPGPISCPPNGLLVGELLYPAVRKDPVGEGVLFPRPS